MLRIIKRLFDIIGSILCIVLLSPLLLLLYFLVRNKMGYPAIFKQQRPGQSGKLFMIYKFRTMMDTYDFKDNILSDSLRLNRCGRLLRKTSLDELPELFNILKGDMSFVGPRPLLVKYLDRYSEEQARRHEVKPGLTGWAQVNGRNSISWDEKFKLDVWYVDNWSIFLDVKILLLTLIKVFRSEDINASDEVTMSEFKGDDEKK